MPFNETLCKGCHTYEVTKGKCITKSTITKMDDSNELICPCSLCLIKSMCSDPCDEMRAFYHKVMNLDKEEWS